MVSDDDGARTETVMRLKERLANPSLTCSLRLSTPPDCGVCGASIGASSPGFTLPKTEESATAAATPALTADAAAAAPKGQALERPIAWFQERRLVLHCSATCAHAAASTSSVRSSPLAAPSSSSIPPTSSTFPTPSPLPPAFGICASQEHKDADFYFAAPAASRDDWEDEDELMLEDDIIMAAPEEEDQSFWAHCGYISDSEEDEEDSF